MKSRFASAVMVVLTVPGFVQADDDCRRPMTEWQSREAVTSHVTEMGIAAERLRVDDGCYEIRGQDTEGNRVEMKIDPATLDILKLEVRFRPGAGPSPYLPGIERKGSTIRGHELAPYHSAVKADEK